MAMSSIEECADLCNKKENCRSFEYQQSTLECYIKMNAEVIGKSLQDSVLCKKLRKEIFL